MFFYRTFAWRFLLVGITTRNAVTADTNKALNSGEYSPKIDRVASFTQWQGARCG